MADQYVAEIRVFPFQFAPRGWAFCMGQIMAISQNTALFSLLGTMYGGDGKSTFGLPDLQGRLANCQGQGPGLSYYAIGEMAGEPFVTLLSTEIPVHTHTLMAELSPAADTGSPTDAALGLKPGVTNMYTNAAGPIQQFAFQALAPNGNSQPHNNMMPFLTLNFCIALQGIYPPRS